MNTKRLRPRLAVGLTAFSLATLIPVLMPTVAQAAVTVHDRVHLVMYCDPGWHETAGAANSATATYSTYQSTTHSGTVWYVHYDVRILSSVTSQNAVFTKRCQMDGYPYYSSSGVTVSIPITPNGADYYG